MPGFLAAEPEGPPGHDASCVLHVHSTYSDGTATVPELLEAARATGVEVLVLTDHDTLGARRCGWEGFHDGALLLVGEEISPRGGHYLAIGASREIGHSGRSPAAIAASVRAAGGVGIAAHPFSGGGRMLVPALARRIVRPHAWPELARGGGPDGIELWSLTTDAAESWRTPLEAARWLRNMEAAVAGGPPAGHLRTWDALSARRRLPAVGGLDGHQPGLRLGGRVFSPLPHERTFRLLRTHLICERPLSGDLDRDRASVIAALRDGSAWLHAPHAGPARGARFWLDRAGESPVPLGGKAVGAAGALRVRLPRPADLLLLRDGTPIAAADARSAWDRDVDGTGAYRIEARIGGRFWLLSNPIHVRSPAPSLSLPDCELG